MKPVALSLIIFLFGVNVNAQQEISPVHSILWNKFNQLEVVGEHVMGLSENGLSLMKIDPLTGWLLTETVLTLPNRPAELKIFGEIALIRTENFDLHFVDLSKAPVLTLLGTINPGFGFADYTLDADFIYFARWFEGLTRFRLNDYNEITFDDASYYGALITQIYIYNNDLFALDAYNGLLRYDIAPAGIGLPVDSLVLEKKVAKFVPFDESIMLLMEEGGASVTDFAGGGGNLIDSIPGISFPQDVFITPDEYVFVSGHFISVMNRADHANVLSGRLNESSGGGALLTLGGLDFLILPNLNGGAYRYPLTDPGNSYRLFNDQGLINEISLAKDRLYAAGSQRTLDVYQFNKNAPPGYSYTLYPDLSEVKMFDRRADTILTLLANSDLIGLIVRADNPDSFFFEASVTVEAQEILELEFISGWGDGCWFVAARSDALDIYHYVNGVISLVTTWTFGAPLRAFEIRNDDIWVSLENLRLEVYDINDQQDITLKASLLTDRIVDEMFLRHDTAYLFQSRLLTVMDMSIAAFPKIIIDLELPLAAVDLAADKNGRLFTVGAEGLCLLTLTDSIPFVSAVSQFGGSYISYYSDWLAVSDGGSIHLFEVEGIGLPHDKKGTLPVSYFLAQNYPNPFNGSTKINFELPEAATTSLTVHNLLGQQVKTLLDKLLPAGTYSVSWDGTDTAGKSVSSALYFYRLKAGSFAESKKMMLLK